jgi:hypothetical protein
LRYLWCYLSFLSIHCLINSWELCSDQWAEETVHFIWVSWFAIQRNPCISVCWCTHCNRLYRNCVPRVETLSWPHLGFWILRSNYTILLNNLQRWVTIMRMVSCFKKGIIPDIILQCDGFNSICESLTIGQLFHASKLWFCLIFNHCFIIIGSRGRRTYCCFRKCKWRKREIVISLFAY